MKVVLRNPNAPDGVKYWSLTVGREYEVLGMSDDSCQLLDDTNEPILFDLSCFEVTDPQEPAFWQTKYGEEGERYAGPPGWKVPGFFEAWHDGDELIKRVFFAQLAFWYPGIELRSQAERNQAHDRRSRSVSNSDD